MIIVLGTARTRPARRDELLTAMHEVAHSTRTDDGCVSYRFATDIDDPDVIVAVEVWRDQAALDAHMLHDHTAAFVAGLPGLIDGEPVLTIHHVAATA